MKSYTVLLLSGQVFAVDAAFVRYSGELIEFDDEAGDTVAYVKISQLVAILQDVVNLENSAA